MARAFNDGKISQKGNTELLPLNASWTDILAISPVTRETLSTPGQGKQNQEGDRRTNTLIPLNRCCISAQAIARTRRHGDESQQGPAQSDQTVSGIERGYSGHVIDRL